MKKLIQENYNFTRPLSLLIFLLILSFGLLFSNSAQAISLNKKSYTADESILFTSTGGPWVLYNLTDNNYVGSGGSHFANDDIGSYSVSVSESKNYSILEMENSGVCEGGDLTYSQCKARPEFISEFLFDVSGRGTGGFTNYQPEAALLNLKKDVTVGQTVEIIYQSKDRNDELGQSGLGGLLKLPVSIFYAPSYDFRPDKRKLIVKDLPAAGSYKWETKGVEEGLYKIIVRAEDVALQAGEAVSAVITIDNLAPVFVVKAEPAVSQSEDVRIIVEASEDLAEPPQVKIVQKFSPLTVEPKITGKGKFFEGVYNVIKGYDGLATISISGKDKAGNLGNTIVGGGRFYVGIEPPPKPIVSSPIDKDVVSSKLVSVLGNAREDTEVLLLVNGKDEYKTKPDKEGNFVFENIKINPEFNKGVNYLSVTAKDVAGNISEAVNLSIKFNLNPEISIVSPKKDDILTGTFPIKIDALDKNKDKLSFTYEISQDSGKTWSLLADSIPTSKYDFDTTLFPDGEYILRVTANDGFAKIEVVSDKFSIGNSLPVISFIDGEKTVSSKKDIVISGLVTIPVKIRDKSKLVGLEYSLNEGKDWVNLSALDGSFDSFEEKFSLSLKDLTEQTYTILFRAKDSRGFYGRARKALIVDFGLPPTPEVLELKSLTIFSNQDDQDKDIAGVQITVSGNAEPASFANILIDDKVFSGKTGADGKFEVQITLRKHGQNNLKIFAFDAAGNKSSETKLSLIYNNPPTIRFINPRPDRGLNHKSKIKWEIQDVDLDSVKDITLSYRKSNTPFEVLAKNPAENTYELDVTNFSDSSDYQLKLEATDGVSPAVKIINFYIDNTSPEISVEPLSETVFRKDFVLKAQGQAFDNFSGIEFVEFSVDGEHWFKALITRGFLARDTTFRIRQKLELEDGTYDVSFRAIDVAGNLSEIKSQQIIVDKSPPRIGSYTLSKGNIVVFPEGDIFKILRNTKMKLIISLEQDSKEATLSLNDKKVSLEKNNSTGLWEADLDFIEVGNFEMKISVIDQIGNITENKESGLINVVKPGLTKDSDGQPISDVKINTFIFDEETKTFNRWQAESLQLKNPVSSNEAGEYELLLPSGKYQLLIQKAGFERVKTSEFEIPEIRFINFDFQLEKREGLRGIFENIIDIIGL